MDEENPRRQASYIGTGHEANLQKRHQSSRSEALFKIYLAAGQNLRTEFWGLDLAYSRPPDGW